VSLVHLVLAVKKFYDDGDLGNVIFAEGHYLHEIKDYFHLTPWRLNVPQYFMYGGVCHPLDSLVWFLGDVDEVHCYANRAGLSAYPIEENFLLNVKFRNGVIARVLGAYGMVQPPWSMMGLTIYGTTATATATFEDFLPSQVRIVFDKLEGNQPAVIDYPADPKGAYGQGDAVIRYMKHFEDCIVNDKTPSEDAREGTKTIAALEAAWESARTGVVVTSFLEFIRLRYVWWVFHPAGYVVSIGWMGQYWLSLFFAWAMKASLLKYVGIQSYRQSLPFFMGLILGDFLGGAGTVYGISLQRRIYNFMP
jgi:predicted dehydrogenase